MFLFPLLIGHYQKINICPLLSGYPEGIPVNIAAKLLPFKSRFNPAVWMHVLLQKNISEKNQPKDTSATFSKKKLLLLVDHLYNTIAKLNNDRKTNWNNYYTSAITGGDYLAEKEKIISSMLDEVKGKKLLDLGANDGYFSLLAATKNFSVIAIDSDEQCITSLYRKIKDTKLLHLLPLCIDISNATPASGFAGKERSSFHERIYPDVVLALALIHHLALAGNIPLPMLADYFAGLAPQLIIEFVPKEDEKTKLLLQNKKDIFPGYSIARFEEIFSEKFVIENKETVGDTRRSIYFMKRR
jgi:hypothetical protein